MKRFLAVILILCTVLCSLTGCEKQARTTVFAMDTVMDLQVWGENTESVTQLLGELLRSMEDRWSATAGNSLLGQLNRGQTPELTGEEAALLERVIELSDRTGGAFDPRLYDVSLLWGFYNDAHHIPSEQELAEALTQKRWDLGAAMKGYAGDRCVQLLETMDIDRAILNLGGNIQTYGEKPDGSPWRIGIQNPDGGDYVGMVEVTGTASVVTSGDYQRFFEQDGIRYHHIIDPETGKPARSGLRSVTVICRDGLTADALSTALFVMGLEEATAFWQASDDFEAVFITDQGKIYATQGANLTGCEFEVISR